MKKPVGTYEILATCEVCGVALVGAEKRWCVKCLRTCAYCKGRTGCYETEDEIGRSYYLCGDCSGQHTWQDDIFGADIERV